MFSNVTFYFPKRCNVRKTGSTNQRQKKMGMIMDPRNESLPCAQQKMSKREYYRNVRFVKLIHNQISLIESNCL